VGLEEPAYENISGELCNTLRKGNLERVKESEIMMTPPLKRELRGSLSRRMSI
jgi:hypothetical protein